MRNLHHQSGDRLVMVWIVSIRRFACLNWMLEIGFSGKIWVLIPSLLLLNSTVFHLANHFTSCPDNSGNDRTWEISFAKIFLLQGYGSSSLSTDNTTKISIRWTSFTFEFHGMFEWSRRYGVSMVSWRFSWRNSHSYNLMIIMLFTSILEQGEINE